MTEVKNASIEAAEGGFIVYLGSRTVVTVTLSKAIKLVREYLGETSASSAE